MSFMNFITNLINVLQLTLESLHAKKLKKTFFREMLFPIHKFSEQGWSLLILKMSISKKTSYDLKLDIDEQLAL